MAALFAIGYPSLMEFNLAGGTMKSKFIAALFGLGALMTASGLATAADKYTLRALGTFQGQMQSSDVERPFFEALKKEPGGAFDVQFRTMDEVGLRGFDAMRMLKLGVFDVMAVQLGYVSGDEPFVLGLDLPGVAADLTTAQKVVNAYRERFSRLTQEKYNAYTVALWPFPGQVFFCRGEIGGLSDLKGKKVRSFSPSMGQLIEHLGGVPVSLAFSEVYPSLQRGVADCGITATLSGNTSKWFEVTNHLYPLSIGWGIQAHMANKDFIDRLAPDARAALLAKFKKLEDDMWDLSFKTFDDGINCNTGVGTCQYGTKANMKLVPIKPADVEALRQAAKAVVLPAWAKDCNAKMPDCSKIWNETVGAAVGMKID